MYKTVIENFEFEIWRSLQEASDFIEEVFLRIEKNYRKEENAYRLSQGNYKEFEEEYIPLCRYLKFKYGLNSDISFRHLGLGNQPYDGEIRNSQQVERIEIAYFAYSKILKKQQRSVLEDKDGTICIDPTELIEIIEKRVLKTASEKANKPYEGAMLVFYFAASKETYPGEAVYSKEEFEELINKLRGIDYTAEKVDLFIPTFEFIGEEGEEIIPAKVYKIK